MMPNYPSLVGRGVLVTGGATGIGADIVRAFCRQGAAVGFMDIQDEPAKALIEELADTDFPPIYRKCDLTDLDGLAEAVPRLARDLGTLSILINNAAEDTRHRVEDVTPTLWDHLLGINLRAQFFVAQAVYPFLKTAGGGSITNLSSISYRMGASNMPVYATAKAGIVGMTYALARAFGGDRIRVNAVEPGAVMTERQRSVWYTTEESVQSLVDRQILRATLLGEHIADMVVFLASDQARMITKQTFVVDAGMS